MYRIKRINRIILIIILATLTASVLGAIWVYGYLVVDPRANEQCGICHSIKPFIEDISNTSHGEFNCHTCHRLTLGVIREIFVYVLENPNSTVIEKRWAGNIPLYDECISCHKLDEIIGTPTHILHLEEEEFINNPCTVCHNPHKPELTQRLCLNCHGPGGEYEESD